MTYREKIAAAAQQIIDFDYTIYGSTIEEQTEFRKQLNIDICRHYLMREIGYETLELWKIMLEERLSLIMPRYKQMYDTTLFTLDINNPYHMITTHNENGKDSLDGNRSSTDDITENSNDNTIISSTDTTENSIHETSDNTSKITASNNNKVVSEGTSNSVKNSDNIHSDFPQVEIANDYASTEDVLKEDINNTDNNTQTTTGSNTQNTTGNNTLDHSDTGTSNRDGKSDNTHSSTSNHKFGEEEKEIRDRIMNYLHDVKGRTDNMQILNAIEKWRELIVNINEMIINELTDLFMLVY